jgi:hypothetical protein
LGKDNPLDSTSDPLKPSKKIGYPVIVVKGVPHREGLICPVIGHIRLERFFLFFFLSGLPKPEQCC